MSRDSIEAILRSPGRYRVLKYLIVNGGGNISRISRELEMSYTLVRRYLEELVAAGVVEEIRLGRARYFTPVWRDPRLRILRELIESSER